MKAFALRCLFVATLMAKLATVLLLLALKVEAANVNGRYERVRTECHCKTPSIPTADEFVCHCSDVAENKSYYYPLSEIPLNNLTASVSFFMGDASTQLALISKEECSTQPRFKLLDTTPRPTNATQPTFIQFNNFDFDDNRSNHFSPWLENIRNYLKSVHILCGTMRTLRRGMLQGFINLGGLSIVQTGLHNIDARAFDELGGGLPTKMGELFVVGNPMESFDWSVLQPVAFSLKHIWMTRNRIDQMYVSSPVSFPALWDINLESNRLRSISADVVATWREEPLLVELIYNPLCSRDSLCRCCSLVPLFQFAKRTSSELRVFCGQTDREDYCETTFVSRTSKCTSPCVKDGNLTDIAQLSDYDYCDDFAVDTMSCEPP